jgi:AcrR family transcriptional regulator
MITKRTQNAAHIRYKIINYVLETCKHKEFDKIHVTDICTASDISKVTFFKYFDKKEDILLLFKSILNFGICIDVSKRDLHGLAGLELIIDRFAQIIRETPSVATQMLTTLLHTKPPILPVHLTEADRALFFPDQNMDNVSLLPFWDLIEGFMLEGILSKEIIRFNNPADLSAVFISLIYGGVVTSHIRNRVQQSVYFNNICKNWVRSLKS